VSLPKSVYERLPKRMPHSLGFSRHALDFDGVDDYVGVGMSYSQWNDPHTWCLWANFDDVSTEREIAGFWDDSVSSPDGLDVRERIWALDLDGDGNIEISYNRYTSNPYWSVTPEVNTWYFICAVYYGTSDGTMELWVNGEKKATTNNTNRHVDGANEWWVGAAYGEFKAHFAGEIDDVRIYDRALSAEEVRRDMLNYHNPVKNGLVGWWRFEEGTGLTAHDKSGNGNDGTINGATWVENEKQELRVGVEL